MRLKSAMERLKYDTRMIDLNLQNGILDQSEYKSHLDQLRDDEEKSEKVDVDFTKSSTYDKYSDNTYNETLNGSHEH